MKNIFTQMKEQLREQEELERYNELSKKYGSMTNEPNYRNMTLRQELETRMDLQDFHNLQEKYGTTPTPWNREENKYFTSPPDLSQQAQNFGSVQNNTNQQQSSYIDENWRLAEQLATGFLDGYTYGWFDEANGLASAAKYGAKNLFSTDDTEDEGFLDATKRGYFMGRDNRRQILKEAQEEYPNLTTTAQTAGAFAAPGGIVFKLGKLNALDKGAAAINAVVNTLLYGTGSGEDTWQSYVAPTFAAAVGNGAGYKLLNYSLPSTFYHSLTPIVRRGISPITSTAMEKIIDYGGDLLDNKE